MTRAQMREPCPKHGHTTAAQAQIRFAATSPAWGYAENVERRYEFHRIKCTECDEAGPWKMGLGDAEEAWNTKHCQAALDKFFGGWAWA